MYDSRVIDEDYLARLHINTLRLTLVRVESAYWHIRPLTVDLHRFPDPHHIREVFQPQARRPSTNQSRLHQTDWKEVEWNYSSVVQTRLRAGFCIWTFFKKTNSKFIEKALELLSRGLSLSWLRTYHYVPTAEYLWESDEWSCSRLSNVELHTNK